MGLLRDILSFFKGKPQEEIKVVLTCPNCPDEELVEKENMEVTLYLCNSCHGCFLTQTSLNNFLKFHNENDWPDLFELRADGEHTYDRSKAFRKCPACKESMENVEFQYTSGIWVDYCPNGQGIWLDSGELRLIKEFKSFTPTLTPTARAVYDAEKPEVTINISDPESEVKEIKEIREENFLISSEMPEEAHKEPVKEIDTEDHVKEKAQKSSYIQILKKLPHGRFQEYRQRAEKGWETDRVNYDNMIMTEDYLKEKVRQYAEEEGII